MKATIACIFGAALLVSAPPALAQNASQSAFLSDDGKTLAYAPCAEEEAAECVSHSLNCRGDSGFGNSLAFSLLGGTSDPAPDIRKLATALIARPFGEAKIRFILGGSTEIDAAAHSITVSTNEMNGELDLALHFYQGEAFLDALTAANAADVKADIESFPVVLADDTATGEKLMKFKAACGG